MSENHAHAIIFYGGWDGHEPERCARLFHSALLERGFSVDLCDGLDILDEARRLAEADLICPMWTMGTISPDQVRNLSQAVRSGTGLGGFHGGMGDAFRGATEYEWMVGGHFVGHPHVGPYTVRVRRADHPVTAHLDESFEYDSEQYYMLTDPGVDVLADTEYLFEGRACAMPVVWTKIWGAGRVFYSALGHKPEEFETWPNVFEMTLAGLEWAARKPRRNRPE